MKKFKFFAMILGLSFGLTAMGVNAWTYKPFGILFENWGTQTINTAYADKETSTAQRWETLEVSNGGNPEVVLQGKTLGSVSDNGWTIGMTNVTGFWWKY